MISSSVRRPATGLILLTLAAVTVTSCSSSGGSTAGATPTANASADAATLGAPKTATGTPVTLGFINAGQGPSIDARPEISIANATVKYINAYLGGVAGHPISLKICATGATPAGAQDCANKMVAAGVPAVLEGAPGVPGPIVTTLEKAKIPYFTYATVEQSVLLSPDAYVLSNTLGGLASPIELAKQTKSKHVAEIVIDVPAAIGPIKGLGEPLFKRAGIKVDYFAIPPGTADITPQIQAALSKGADLFSVTGDPALCESAFSALNTLGFKGPRLANPQCLSPGLAKSVPGGVKGVTVGTTESFDTSDREVALYNAILRKYSPKSVAHLSANSSVYAAFLGFARALAGYHGAITKQTVPVALAAAAPAKMPLLAGQTFVCNRKVFKLTPAVCSTGMALAVLDSAGNPGKSVPFDSAPILNG
jgi:branched-chain amino acid transport system substrate-binding protein